MFQSLNTLSKVCKKKIHQVVLNCYFVKQSKGIHATILKLYLRLNLRCYGFKT